MAAGKEKVPFIFPKYTNYLLLCNKLPQIFTSENKHNYYLTTVLGVRNLGGSGSKSLMRLQSWCQRGYRYLTGEKGSVSNGVIFKRAGWCWLLVGGLFLFIGTTLQGHLNILTTWKLASLKASYPNESQAEAVMTFMT